MKVLNWNGTVGLGFKTKTVMTQITEQDETGSRESPPRKLVYNEMLDS